MSSIRREISAQTLANQAILERRQNKRTIVLVEGGTDSRFYRRYLRRDTTAITVCHDREKVFLTLGVLEERGEAGILGIVDEDFARFCENDPVHENDNIVTTSENDVEILIFPNVAPKIIGEYGTEEKVVSARAAGIDPVRMIFEEAAKIGAIRAISKRDSLNLRFSNMDYKFLSNAKCEIDLDNSISEILSKSNTTLEADALKILVTSMINDNDAKHLCNGHDVVRIFGRSLRREFGSEAQFDKNDKNKNGLYSIMRVSHEFENFEMSALCASLANWERHNKPWKAL